MIRKYITIHCDHPDCWNEDNHGGTDKKVKDRCERKGWKITKYRQFCPDHNVRERKYLEDLAEEVIQSLKVKV
jgi:hypothetical protein